MFNSEPSFEVLAWQRSNRLAPALSESFDVIIDNFNDKGVVTRVFREICERIYDETGLTFQMRTTKKSWFTGPFEISVLAPNLNAVSPVNMKAVERLRKFDVTNMQILDTIDGFIDYKHGKVGGFFSKLVHEIVFSEATFDGSIPPNELTAATLHEVGHGWTNCALLGETLATNVVIAELIGQYDFETDSRKKFEIGVAAQKLAGVTVEEPGDTAKLTALVLKGTVARMQARTGTRWYDQRLTESLSDAFAVRFGVGADLVKAISRFERGNHLWASPGYEPAWIGLMFNFANIVNAPFAIANELWKSAARVTVETIARSFGFAFFFNCLSEITRKATGSAHMPTKQRIQAIRREVVSELRNPNLEDERRQQILADLAVIDAEAGSAHSFTDVYSILSKWITNKITGRSSELGYHDQVEDLANNRLYEFSAQLKG